MGVSAINRPTKAIISKKAVQQNIQTIKTQLNDNVKLFAVVKANAYGHGLVEFARIAQDNGADGFCVACLDEAIALRNSGINLPILVLGVTYPLNSLELASDLDISLTVCDNTWLQQAIEILKSKNKKIKIHIAVDTGMTRIGYRDHDDIKKSIQLLQNDYFIVEGIFTHFSTADEKDDKYFKQQQMNFERLIDLYPFNFTYIHTANTATTLWHDAWRSNMVRFGIGMYGMNPSGTVQEMPYKLQPVMQLETEIVFVKQVEKGVSIGYGATYTTSEDEWIATLPIGYADGLVRRYTGFELLVDGHRCPIVGRVCMDQLMIKLPKYYPVGTKVVIIGQSKDQVNTFEMAASHVGTINYEMSCAISERVHRIYE